MEEDFSLQGCKWYIYYPSVFELDPSKRAEIRTVSEFGYSVSNPYLNTQRRRYLFKSYTTQYDNIRIRSESE